MLHTRLTTGKLTPEGTILFEARCPSCDAALLRFATVEEWLRMKQGEPPETALDPRPTPDEVHLILHGWCSRCW